MGSHQGLTFQPTNRRRAYHLNMCTLQKLLSNWSKYLTVLDMTERSKLNEIIPDMTPNEMLLEVGVSPNNFFF